MNNNLHITIGSAPSDLGLLHNEINMLKCSLLYGDKTKLFSLSSSLLFLMLQATKLNFKQQIELIESLAPNLMTDKQQKENFTQNMFMYRKICNKKYPSSAENINRLKIEKQLKKSWELFSNNISHLLDQAGVANIILAINSGLLDLHFFDTTMNNEKLINDFVYEITKTITDSNTYPLFDQLVSSLVKSQIEENLVTVSDSMIHRSKHVGLAAKLIEKLPLFENATIDEILDIRNELEKPLVRFRSAMIRLSGDIKNATWDNDFIFDVENIFMREVEPAILDIEEVIKQNNYLSMLIRRMTTKPNAAALGSVLGFGISTFNQFSELYSPIIGFIAGAPFTAYDIRKEWQKNNVDIEKNCMFFYYKVGTLLN